MAIVVEKWLTNVVRRGLTTDVESGPIAGFQKDLTTVLERGLTGKLVL